MKKLIVLLLAFAMVGAVSAQVTTAITLKGNVTIADQDGNSVFAPKGNGYDTFTFSAKEKDGKYGFSMTDQNVLDGSFDTLRDWNVWTTGKYAKVIAGNLRNGDFRLAQAYGGTQYLTATDRISGQGFLVESLPISGFSFGINLPIGTTAGQFTDILQNADIGAKYVIKDVGTVIAMFNLDLVAPAANVLNVGVNYTAIKNLPIIALFKGQFDASDYRFSVGTDYTGIDKLDLFVEADVKSATTIGWSVLVEGDYAVTDKLTAIVGGSVGDGTDNYDVWAEADYACLPALTGIVYAGYDGALYAGLKAYYAVTF